MKRLVILLMMVLSVSLAYGQHRDANQFRRHKSEYRERGDRGRHEKKPGKSHGKNHVKHLDRGGRHADPHHGSQKVLKHHHGGPRAEVYCTGDWQELWNGRHVRLKMNQVCIFRKNGDELLRGDEVILLPLGSYCVRKGDTWRIYDEDGNWFTGISSHYVIEQLWNGCYVYERDGKFYVADEQGSRIFNVWGDWVELMDNGLFRCHRNDRNYYYDKYGNQRD